MLKPFNAFIFMFLKQIFKVIINIYCIQCYFCTVFCSHLYSCKHFGPILNSPRHICMIDTLSYRVIWNLFQNRPILNSLAEMKGQI